MSGEELQKRGELNDLSHRSAVSRELIRKTAQVIALRYLVVGTPMNYQLAARSSPDNVGTHHAFWIGRDGLPTRGRKIRDRITQDTRRARELLSCH